MPTRDDKSTSNTGNTGGGKTAASSTSNTSGSKTPSAKSAPRRESDIAHRIGVVEQERRAVDARNANKVTRTPSAIAGEPDTISGETVEQMRDRVAAERAAAEPTEFQKSLIGRPVSAIAPNPTGTDVGTASSGVGGVGGVSTTGTSNTTGTTGTTGSTGTV